MDIRANLTKMHIADSLLKLMEQEHIQNISVKQLCYEANISRTTFYQYFPDIFSLLDQIENDFVQKMMDSYTTKQIRTKPEYRDFCNALCRFFYANREEFLILYGKNGSRNLYRKIVTANRELMYTPTDAKTFRYSLQYRELVIDYIWTGALQLISEWLTNKEEVSVTEIASLLVQLSYDAVHI